MWQALKDSHNRLSDAAEDSFLFLSRVPGRGYLFVANSGAIGYALFKLFV